MQRVQARNPKPARHCRRVWTQADDDGGDLWRLLRRRTQGQVVSIVTANNLLFTAGQDCSIRVWAFDASSSQFTPQVNSGRWCGGGSPAGPCCGRSWHGSDTHETCTRVSRPLACQATLTAENADGHKRSVVTMVGQGAFLFSGDQAGAIKASPRRAGSGRRLRRSTKAPRCRGWGCNLHAGC